MPTYFTDREFGSPPATVETIDDRVWGGLYMLIRTRLDDGSFGYRFPKYCEDGKPYGCDERVFRHALEGEVPLAEWPLSPNDTPDTLAILDILVFAAKSVGYPIDGRYHPYFEHYHLTWDRDAGLEKFVNEANLIFTRNGVAYELTPEGEARRKLPQLLAETLATAFFVTGDDETDRLLNMARTRISSPRTEDRQDALEKLWDGFERLKTLEPGDGKKLQAQALLNLATISSGEKFRQMIDRELRELTDIGNSFRIRHAEVSQESVKIPTQIDYLFFRMFSLLHFLLRETGRLGRI